MRPFDLDAAKSGEKVCLRDGTPVRIVCFDRKHDFFETDSFGINKRR